MVVPRRGVCVRSHGLEKLTSLHGEWGREASGVEIRAIAPLPICLERPDPRARVERHRVQRRHRDRAVIVYAAVLLHEVQEHLLAVLLVVDAHEEVARGSSNAEAEDGGEVASQLLLLAA